MAITPILSSAFSGLRASALQADSAAGNIANINTPGYTATRVQQSPVVSAAGNLAGGTGVSAQIVGSGAPPDLARGIIGLIVAEASYKASAEMIRTAEELEKRVVDLAG